MNADLKIGVIIVSDTAYSNPQTDKSKVEFEKLLNKFTCVIVPDDKKLLTEQLIKWSDTKEDAMELIITTGGTGFTPRDVTPEVTKSVINKEAPGIQTALMINSLQKTPKAMLSRGICGVRNETLIINFPGNPKAISECWECIGDVLPHAVDQLKGRVLQVKSVHRAMREKFSCSCDHTNTKEDQLESSAVPSGYVSVSSRPRHSPYPILNVSVAQTLLLEQCSHGLGEEYVPLQDALHRIVCKDYFALENVPPFPASIKDGYAVIASDGAGDRLVIGCSNAGDETLAPDTVTVVPGTCCRISTGAALPPGADSVVQVEDTILLESDPTGLEELRIRVLQAPSPITGGQDVRPMGSDIAKGQLLLNSSTQLGPSELGLLAAAGLGTSPILCSKSPRVGVLSTGNELIHFDEVNTKGDKIRDCNRVALVSTIRSWGYQVVDLGIANDTIEDIQQKLQYALEECDMLVTSGGVSMGEKDLLKSVILQEFQGTIHFARILMKPGKPTTFATIPKTQLPDGSSERKLFICALPGNPVSAMVTCQLFVLPALKKLSGVKDNEDLLGSVIRVKVGQNLKLDPARPEYHRCVLKWPSSTTSGEEGLLPLAISTGNQISSRLLSMHGANVLLLLPRATEEKKEINAGEIVSALMME